MFLSGLRESLFHCRYLTQGLDTEILNECATTAFIVHTMVLILDGNSEHAAHA